MTTKPTGRSPARRGSSASAERTEAKLQEVVSVRLSEEELRRIQAFAVIFETTANAVIRDACSFYLAAKVGSAEYQQALEAYHQRMNQVVDVLERIRNVGEPVADEAPDGQNVKLRHAAR